MATINREHVISLKPRKNVSGARYSFNCTGPIRKLGDTESSDNINGGRVTGGLYSKPDSYAFLGGIWNLDLPAGVSVLVNGDTLRKRLRMKPIVGGRKEYRIATNGYIVGMKNTEPADAGNEVRNISQVSGSAYALSDSFRYSGGLRDVISDPGLELYSGSRLFGGTKDEGYSLRAPKYKLRWPRKLRLEPRRNVGGATYRVNTDGQIRPAGGIERDDSSYGSWVRGSLGGKADAWNFRGNITGLRVPKGVDVVVDWEKYGTRVDVTGVRDSPGDYWFATDARVIPLMNTNDADEIKIVGDSAVVNGRVVDGTDSYLVAGSVKNFGVPKGAKIEVNGRTRKDRTGELGPKRKVKRNLSNSGPAVGITLRSSRKLLGANGRVSETQVVKALATSFDERNMNYRIWYNFPAYNPPTEETVNLKALKQFRSDMQNGNHFVAKDSNILIKNRGGGGMGFVGGQFGQSPGRHITDNRPIKKVETNEDKQHRNLHANLHEIGHNLGAKHGPHSVDSGKVLGNAWVVNGNYHRTPNAAVQGVENVCGQKVEGSHDSFGPRILHNVYSRCAANNFIIRPESQSQADIFGDSVAAEHGCEDCL